MNLIKGFGDTFNILAAKWSGIKKERNKIFIIAAVAIFAFFLYILANTGSLIIYLITTVQPGAQSQQVQQYVLSYLETFSSGELNLYVTGVLGATLGMILISPFSGYSLGGVVPSRDLAIVKASDNYRISDSIIVQILSSLTLIQLISLTMLASLMTIEGGTGPAIIYAWIIWLAIVLIATTFMWITEYVNRKYGFKVKIGIILTVVVALTIALLLDPFKGSTFFGLSPIIIDVLQNLYSYNIWESLLAYSVPVGIIIVFSGLLSFIASKALHIQEPISLKKQKKFAKKEKWSEISLFKTILSLVFRYKVIWRPIFITTLFSFILMLILGNQTDSVGTLLISLIVIIPLVVSLSFSVNIFGIFGSSNIWLASSPSWRKNILTTTAAVQLGITALIYVTIFAGGLLFQKITFVDVWQSIPAIISSLTIMTVYSLSKSLKNPVKYMPSSRGDAILPPLTILNYMLKLIFLGGLFGSTVFYLGADYQWQVTLGIVLVSALVFYKKNKSWVEKEEYLNNVIKATTGD